MPLATMLNGKPVYWHSNVRAEPVSPAVALIAANKVRANISAGTGKIASAAALLGGRKK